MPKIAENKEIYKVLRKFAKKNGIKFSDLSTKLWGNKYKTNKYFNQGNYNICDLPSMIDRINEVTGLGLECPNIPNVWSNPYVEEWQPIVIKQYGNVVVAERQVLKHGKHVIESEFEKLIGKPCELVIKESHIGKTYIMQIKNDSNSK